MFEHCIEWKRAKHIQVGPFSWFPCQGDWWQPPAAFQTRHLGLILIFYSALPPTCDDGFLVLQMLLSVLGPHAHRLSCPLTPPLFVDFYFFSPRPLQLTSTDCPALSPASIQSVLYVYVQLFHLIHSSDHCIPMFQNPQRFTAACGIKYKLFSLNLLSRCFFD